MSSPLEHILTHSHKKEMIAFVDSNPSAFEEALQLAKADKQPYSWRAAWLLWSCMKPNDSRILKSINEIVELIPTRKSNQQRELLMIMQRMKLTDDFAGPLFDVCIQIWRKLESQPSLRMNAFKILLAIAKKYPDMANELKHLTEPYYTETLSPGAKHSFSIMIKNYNFNQN